MMTKNKNIQTLIVDLQQADTFLSKDELSDWAETFIIKVG
jgi:hypothetical protein